MAANLKHLTTYSWDFVIDTLSIGWFKEQIVGWHEGIQKTLTSKNSFDERIATGQASQNLPVAKRLDYIFVGESLCITLKDSMVNQSLEHTNINWNITILSSL